MKVLRVRNWNDNYENNRTRELKRLDWFPMPNRMDGDGYTTLVTRPHGASLWGAWVVILGIASKCDRRGILLRSNGEPHTSESLGRMSHLPAGLFDEAIQILLNDVKWLDECLYRPENGDITEIPHLGAGIPQDDAGIPQDDAVLTRARRTERNGTERNGTESTAESTVHSKQATSQTTPPDTPQGVHTPKNNRPVRKNLIPWLRSELHAYVKGGTGICRSWEAPDDDICLKILVATHGADSNSIERWLQILYRSQQYPELNYAWFETMAEKRFGKKASSFERAGENPIITGAAGAV